jgi:hypothetical protein
MTRPTLTRGPKAKFVTNTRLETAAVPVTIFYWLGSDALSGLDRYWVQQSLNGAPFGTIKLSSPLATAVVRQLTAGTTYQFQARVVDVAGNTSTPALQTPPFRALLFSEVDAGIAYSAGWVRKGHSYAHGGAVTYATTAGASATFSFSGTSVAWISTRDTNRGQAEVFVDGVSQGIVDLYAATLQGRRIVFSKNDLAPGAHTLQIVVLGTHHPSSGGTRVDLDVLAMLGP